MTAKLERHKGRVLPQPPALSRRVHRMLDSYQGPAIGATPDARHFAGLASKPKGRRDSDDYVVKNLMHPALQPDGHSARSLPKDKRNG